jgi:hypothetical protein
MPPNVWLALFLLSQSLLLVVRRSPESRLHRAYFTTMGGDHLCNKKLNIYILSQLAEVLARLKGSGAANTDIYTGIYAIALLMRSEAEHLYDTR